MRTIGELQQHKDRKSVMKCQSYEEQDTFNRGKALLRGLCIIVTYQTALMLQVSGREMTGIDCLSKCQHWIMSLALRMQGWLLLLLSLQFLSLIVHGSCSCLQTIPVFLILHFQQYLLPNRRGERVVKTKTVPDITPVLRQHPQGPLELTTN